MGLTEILLVGLILYVVCLTGECAVLRRRVEEMRTSSQRVEEMIEELIPVQDFDD